MTSVVVDGQGPVASAIAAALDGRVPAASTCADELVLVARGNVLAMIERVCHARAAVIIVIIDAGWAPMDGHLMRASIERLAIARAPDTRVCAVQIIAGADPADIVAAVEYLLVNQSVTGQVLTVQPCPTLT